MVQRYGLGQIVQSPRHGKDYPIHAPHNRLRINTINTSTTKKQNLNYGKRHAYLWNSQPASMYFHNEQMASYNVILGSRSPKHFRASVRFLYCTADGVMPYT